jgi:hypothetical protein
VSTFLVGEEPGIELDFESELGSCSFEPEFELDPCSFEVAPDLGFDPAPP